MHVCYVLQINIPHVCSTLFLHVPKLMNVSWLLSYPKRVYPFLEMNTSKECVYVHVCICIYMFVCLEGGKIQVTLPHDASWKQAILANLTGTGDCHNVCCICSGW